MKKYRRIISGLMAAAMVMTLIVLPPVERVYAKSREELNESLNETQNKLDNLENKLEKVQGKKEKALEKKTLLDERNAALEDKIETLTSQINSTNKQIKKTEKKEKIQYELFCQQVRQEEERGTITYWSVLFKATDFADLLSRVDFITEIMEHDQDVIEQLKATRAHLAEEKASLKKDKEALNESKAELESQLAEVRSIVSKYKKTEAGLQEMHKAEEAEANRITAELESYLEQNGGGGGGVDAPATQTGLKGLIWPSNTRYITSPYGNRVSPTLGASTFHPGVDIGAPYGSSVFAAQSGTVISAGWNGGYGICVMIAHDEGITTLYGHLCDWSVSVGQQVKRGQVIGQCGSTGISTGPHIHYEIRVNGQTVNPLPYLPGYIPYDW